MPPLPHVSARNAWHSVLFCLQLSETDELVGIFPHQGGGRRWRRTCEFTCACKATTPPLLTGIKFQLEFSAGRSRRWRRTRASTFLAPWCPATSRSSTTPLSSTRAPTSLTARCELLGQHSFARALEIFRNPSIRAPAVLMARCPIQFLHNLTEYVLSCNICSVPQHMSRNI